MAGVFVWDVSLANTIHYAVTSIDEGWRKDDEWIRAGSPSTLPGFLFKVEKSTLLNIFSSLRIAGDRAGIVCQYVLWFRKLFYL